MKYEEEIKPYRDAINRLNNEIITLIAERQDAALAIGEIKKKHDKLVVDKTREQAILDRIRANAPAKGLDPNALERIFTEIIKLCVEAEERK